MSHFVLLAKDISIVADTSVKLAAAMLCDLNESHETTWFYFHCAYTAYVRMILYIYIYVRTSQSGDVGSKSCYYLSTVLDAEHVFTLLYKQYISSPHKMTKVTFFSSHVGSDKLKKVCT